MLPLYTCQIKSLIFVADIKVDTLSKKKNFKNFIAEIQQFSL